MRTTASTARAAHRGATLLAGERVDELVLEDLGDRGAHHRLLVRCRSCHRERGDDVLAGLQVASALLVGLVPCLHHRGAQLVDALVQGVDLRRATGPARRRGAARRARAERTRSVAAATAAAVTSTHARTTTTVVGAREPMGRDPTPGEATRTHRRRQSASSPRTLRRSRSQRSLTPASAPCEVGS